MPRGSDVSGPPLPGFAHLPLLFLALLAPLPLFADSDPPVPIVESPAPERLPEDQAPWPVRAEYMAPTDRYPHGILGRIQGWGSLVVDLYLCSNCESGVARLRIDLPETRVFEDLAPRLWDITGDGRPEIVVIESDAELGARLVVLEAQRGRADGGAALQLLATTPFIGTRFRWLAPVGAVDVTGDGVAEIAYVETPHRDRILRLVSLEGSELVEIAHLEGITNHAIGEEHINGGIRACGGRPEMVVLSADRTNVLAVRYEEGELIPRDLGPAEAQAVPSAALTCPD